MLTLTRKKIEWRWALVLLGAVFTFGLGAGRAGVEDQKPPSTVWVVRGDEAKSCIPGSAISLDQGAKDLKDLKIPILDSKKGHDRKMHSQVCGAETGSENAFLIPREFFDQAKSLGYRLKEQK